jgi:hypothetical protein
MACHLAAYRLCCGPRASNSLWVPLSTTAPSLTTAIWSPNLPAAHLFEVTIVAAPVRRSSFNSLASSTSDSNAVGSSSSSIEPTKLFSTLSLDPEELSLSNTDCASTLVNKSFDHSEGESTLQRGRRREGRKSSSLAVIMVDNLEGSLGRRVE